MIRSDIAAVAGGLAYLVFLGWAMNTLSYDIWGVLVIIPVLILVSAPLIGRAFRGSLAPLRTLAWFGLGAKFVGAIIGYGVRFDAYGGSADATQYHETGRLLAAGVRSGLASPFSLVPTGTNTQFVEQTTGLVYSIVGSSRLAGFVVFAWISYWGLVFGIKAATIAVPRLARRRYAALVFFFPSIVYWGSSTGKEAIVGFGLGVGTYGAALLLADHGRRSVAIGYTIAGLVVAARVRPHFAAIWAGALVVALIVKLGVESVHRRGSTDRRRSGLSVLVLLVIAGGGFLAVASTTLNYLDPVDNEGGAPTEAVPDRLSTIFVNVENRTVGGGSSYTPIDVSGPLDWPYAAGRTLTRPLLTEVHSLAELLPAMEMTALLGLGLVSWRRLVNAPVLAIRTPFVVFVLLCVGTFGVAFASFGNLGLLVRQRSLVLPLLLVLWALPEWWPRTPDVVPPPVEVRVTRRLVASGSTPVPDAPSGAEDVFG